MSKIDVIGLGALNIDNIYKVERILEDGEAVVKEMAAFPGGSAANTIYGLAKLGVNTGFIGAIGDDAEGKTLLRDFKKVGVDTSQIKMKRKAKTGSVLCLSTTTERSLYVLPGANNLLDIKDIDLNYINRARMLHLASFADDRQFKMLLRLIDRLDSPIKVSFAPGTLFAGKGLKALIPLLARTYVLFINRDEIKELTGKDVIAGAEICLEKGCQIVVATLGKGTRLKIGRGSAQKTVTAIAYIRGAEGAYAIEPPKDAPAMASTIGAGDAFATGFLYGFLNGKRLQDCGRLGDIVAQFKIAKMGARPGLPTADQLAQRYQQLYADNGKEIVQ